jgi:carboxylate-amine ligase
MKTPFALFECYGIELEYMIVSRDDLRVLPICDQLLHAVCGAYESEVEMQQLSWSNELVLHVVELKTNGPARGLSGLEQKFQEHVRQVNQLLEPHNAQLMPTAMHPWMNPDTDTRLWPHEYNAVYEAFNRIFDCRGHGWANLQSAHLNLPFANDDEFGKLHAAIRLVLPILPALAASSPILDGRPSGLLDTRLEFYRKNSQLIPSVAGRIIPEAVFTMADYRKQILKPMYNEIAAHDPDGTLQHEWLNARGAIARFDRNAIEIRLLDLQECPAADLAILALTIAVIKRLVQEEWTHTHQQMAIPVEPLEAILLETIRHGEQAQITNPEFLAVFDCDLPTPCRASDLWVHLYETALRTKRKTHYGSYLRHIFEHGTLARRISTALDQDPGHAGVTRIYRELCQCLAEGRSFVIAPDQATHQPARQATA